MPPLTHMRWCSACKLRRLTPGGRYIAYNQGKNQRWVCAACTETAQQRKEACYALQQ